MIDGPRSLSSLDSYKSLVYSSGSASKTTETTTSKKRTVDWEKEYSSITSRVKKVTRSDRQQIAITVKVGYTDDLESVVNVVKRAVKADDSILKDPKPDFGIGNSDDANIEIVVKCWCDKKVYWEVMAALLKDIKMRFFSNGITYKSVVKST